VSVGSVVCGRRLSVRESRRMWVYLGLVAIGWMSFVSSVATGLSAYDGEMCT
jgi:hypothetical protein